MGDINKMIQWMKDNEGKVVYEQVRPWGTGIPPRYDCSAAVISALRAGGFLNNSGGNYGNTETLYGLKGKLLIPISREQVRIGDIFVSGVKGQSLGNGGHTGIFLDNQTIIHCTVGSGKNGIVTTSAKNWMGDYNGWPVYYYRLNGVDTSGGTNKKKKRGNVMLLFKENGTVFWLVGNEYTAIANPTDLNSIKTMIQTAGYDTHEHESTRQISYIKKIATKN